MRMCSNLYFQSVFQETESTVSILEFFLIFSLCIHAYGTLYHMVYFINFECNRITKHMPWEKKRPPTRWHGTIRGHMA
jgi:hypothetical protein